MASQGTKNLPAKAANKPPAHEPPQETAQEETKIYVAYARDPDDEEEVKRTEEAIKKWVPDFDKSYRYFSAPDFALAIEQGKHPEELRREQKTISWDGLELNQTAYEDLKKNPGIEELEIEHGIKFFSATSNADTSTP